MREYVPAVAPALVSTSIMAAAVLLVAALLPAETPMLARLVLKVGVGVAAYAAAVWFLFKENAMSLVRVFTQLRRDGPEAVAAASAPSGQT